MSGAPVWITETHVIALMDMGEAIAALEAGLAQEAAGQAQNMVKTHALWGGHNTLHAIGAVFPGAGVVGTKTWAHTEGGATPLLILYDAHDGGLVAIIEAFALGQLRTGGISGVATRLLAREDADDMALIGTGNQALTQVAAVAAVRRLRRVRIYSRTPERRAAFAQQAATELNLDVVPVDSVEAAVGGASIITLVTRATTPFLASGMVARGAHVNAVGAITPERAEFETDLLERCTVLAGDSVPQVRRLSRELIERFGADEAAWSHLRPLSALVAERATRPAGADVTLFKAMGMGISDLSLGIEIVRRAKERRLCRALPMPQKAKARLRSSPR
jgi:alanine dehydrogenase